MTVFIGSVRMNASTVQGAAKKAALYARTAHEMIGKARSSMNPDLSPEGNRKAQQAATDRAVAEARDAAAALQAEYEQSLAYLTSAAAAVRPAIANTVDGLMAAEQAWRNVQARLDRGVPPRQVLANASIPEALAFEKFAPDYLAAKNHVTADGEPEDFASAITARFAQLSTPEIGELLLAADAAPRQVAAAEPYLRVLAQPIGGGTTMLDAAIQSASIAGTSTKSDSADEAA